jgi:hypothetical protein
MNTDDIANAVQRGYDGEFNIEIRKPEIELGFLT